MHISVAALVDITASMDKNGKDINNLRNSSKNKPPVKVDSEKVELSEGTEEDNEKKSLLPSRKGGLSKKSGKVSLKVQWNDKNGNKLAEVVEFQPSDVSDSEDEDEDSEPCICTIM